MPAKKDTATPELPPAIRVPSDSCTVTVSGTEYHIHRGQSIWMVGTRTVGELQASWGFDRLSVRMNELKGEPDEYGRTLELLENHFSDLLTWIAERLIDWDWTDQRGQPLPKPDGTPEPLRKLTPEEIHYLRQALRGEVAAESGNEPTGTGSLATTSSATA